MWNAPGPAFLSRLTLNNSKVIKIEIHMPIHRHVYTHISATAKTAVASWPCRDCPLHTDCILVLMADKSVD